VCGQWNTSQSALPFEEATFDLVMPNRTLYHRPNLEQGLCEIARVLRRGGRFVGAYNRAGHLSQVWQAINREPPRNSFDGGNGAQALRHHFVVVERRGTCGEVLWESRDALTACPDAYTEMLGPLAAPTGPYPFRASRRNCVFVADKAP
jgi:SAM-dependent methyltransferase